MLRIVADLGNSRLKWGRLGADGRVEETVALPVGDDAAWHSVWHRWTAAGAEGCSWSIATVNPPAAAGLARFLASQAVDRVVWYRSAADVPVRHALERVETAGADRALAVSAALASRPPGRPGLVVLCGTAVTVERVAADGTWQGGAITAGLSLTARALSTQTAQLPEAAPRSVPAAWGNATLPALEAGVYWGVVGALRELMSRQAADLEPAPWVVWTGGDAEFLAQGVGRAGTRIVPDLVLRGLAAVAYGA